MAEFVQKLGLVEYVHDRVIVVKFFPNSLAGSEAGRRLFEDAVKSAQGGDKILWECSPENALQWRDRFVEALCATWLTNRGVEVGPRDPSI